MQVLTKLTDEQLVADYAKGNNEAFDALLKRHQSRVFSYIFHIFFNEIMGIGLRCNLWQMCDAKNLP